MYPILLINHKLNLYTKIVSYFFGMSTGEKMNTRYIQKIIIRTVVDELHQHPDNN
jgi:hypothetical protein